MRFDKEYSYGDEHDAWKEFAKTVGESSADILVCDVGVSGQPSSATAALLCHRSPPLPRLDRTAAPGSHALAVRRCAAEYGDKDNSDIAERFSIKTDDFPQYRLWKKGSDASKDPVKFSGDKKNEEFMKFIQTNAGVWVGLPGQVKELDALAKEFTR